MKKELTFLITTALFGTALWMFITYILLAQQNFIGTINANLYNEGLFELILFGIVAVAGLVLIAYQIKGLFK